jgi:hypothetical protein
METNNDKKHPEGHFVRMWMGIGIVIFSAIGISLSIVLRIPGLLGIGPAIGVALGLALGQSIESKYKKEGKIRPLTEDEKRRRRILIVILTSVFVFGLLIFLLRLFL